MSSTIKFKNTDITITVYNRGIGLQGYQVTWYSSDKGQLFSYVSFNTQAEAKDFARLLSKRINTRS